MEELVRALNNFSPADRRIALERLFDGSPGFGAEKPWVNMHMHTFFSFNGEGYSPSRLAWEARSDGLYAAAVCDFDVLTGLDEFLQASDLLQLRAAAGFETRTFFSEYADTEINSPGEPGVFYFMGMGFVREPASDSAAGRTLASLATRSDQRNAELIERINAKLDPLRVDYQNDVLPLTPAGNATERHIIRAYHENALALFNGNRRQTAEFWAGKLGMESEKIEKTLVNANNFADLLRSKLMKKGGVGYQQPDSRTFPLLDDVVQMILACRAIPVSTWLDGMSGGEINPRTQLECLIGKGIAAVNIIPDRNWNIKESAEREQKINAFHEYVRVADELHLPINIGTELNKPGQRFVDDFGAEAMRPCADTFLRGAQVMVGQTRLLRYADCSYVDENMKNEFPDTHKRNQFFAAVGALPAPALNMRRKLADMLPQTAYAKMHDSVKKGSWQ